MATKENLGQFGNRPDTAMQAKRGGKARAKKTTKRITGQQTDGKLGSIDNTVM